MSEASFAVLSCLGKNGLLKINLERIIPESEKAKVIQINSGELITE